MCTFRGSKNVATATYGVNDLLVSVLVDLGAQAIDVNFNHIRYSFPVGVPEEFAKHPTRDNSALVTHQDF